MSVELEGGCLVNGLHEGSAESFGVLSIWPHFGLRRGAEAISLRVLSCARGESPTLGNREADEVFFVLSGDGVAIMGGREYSLEREDGFFLAAGRELLLRNERSQPLVLASSRCPDPGAEHVAGELALDASPEPGRGALRPFARLREQAVERTGDRWYSVLVGPGQGSERITQFVGSIPPGRAPEHHHHYEEVLCILSGHGTMWAGQTHTPIEPGSCVFLPNRQPHCVENTGTEPLVLLGMFYPAGSPAVRYETPRG